MSGLAPRPDTVTRLLRLAALLLWASTLGFLSLSTNVGSSGLLGWDKFNHFAAYSVLAFLLSRFVTACRPPAARLLLLTWIACFVYGFVIEGLQWVMGAGRLFEWGDILANGLGALTGVIFCHLLGRLFRPNAD